MPKLKQIPKMCITCRHYELYHCLLDDSYIGYLYCDVPTKCKTYSLSDNYRRGGKWYAERLEGLDEQEEANN